MTNIIAIDGPASSGKTILGYGLACKLGYRFLDAGMVYRTGVLVMKENNVSFDDTEGVVKVYSELDLRFRNDSERQVVFMGEGHEDIYSKLYTPQITEMVKIVGAHPLVRKEVRRQQKRFVHESNVVMVGRDVGTEVFPNARLKLYLTANDEVRAIRRHLELLSQGVNIGYGEVLLKIRTRDEHDRNRKASPNSLSISEYWLSNKRRFKIWF